MDYIKEILEARLALALSDYRPIAY
jgi:hypothetical protein